MIIGKIDNFKKNAKWRPLQILYSSTDNRSISITFENVISFGGFHKPTWPAWGRGGGCPRLVLVSLLIFGVNSNFHGLGF